MKNKYRRVFFSALGYSHIEKGHKLNFLRGFESQSRYIFLGQISSSQGKGVESLLFETDPDGKCKYHAVTWRRWVPDYTKGDSPLIIFTEFSTQGETHPLTSEDYDAGEHVCFVVTPGQRDRDRAGGWVLTEDLDHLDHAWIQVKAEGKVIYCGDREDFPAFLKENKSRLDHSMPILKIKFWSIFTEEWSRPTAEERARFHYHLENTFGDDAVMLSPSLAKSWWKWVCVYCKKIF